VCRNVLCKFGLCRAHVQHAKSNAGGGANLSAIVRQTEEGNPGEKRND
jgi:hypothetical protein